MGLDEYHKFMKELKEESKFNYDLIVSTFVKSKLNWFNGFYAKPLNQYCYKAVKKSHSCGSICHSEGIYGNCCGWCFGSQNKANKASQSRRRINIVCIWVGCCKGNIINTSWTPGCSIANSPCIWHLSASWWPSTSTVKRFVGRWEDVRWFDTKCLQSHQPDLWKTL